MRGEAITCDICQKTKGSVNHWWKGFAFRGFTAARIQQSGAMIMPWDMIPPKFVAMRISESLLPVADEQKDFCGAEHAVQWLSRQLSK